MKLTNQIFLAIALNFSLVLSLFSQDYDAQWIQADVPTTVMNFRNDTITFHYLNGTSLAFMATANVCDKDGND